MILNNIEGVVFDPLSHTYTRTDNGDLLMGVTSLMRKHGLSPDYSGIPGPVLQAAAERGTAMHQLIQDYDDGEIVPDCPEVEEYRRLGYNVVRSEYMVTDSIMVASMIDKVIATDEPDTFDLGDIKTTSVFYRRPLEWQLSIYAYLFEKQNPGAKVRRLIGIHIRDGKVREHEVKRIDNAYVESLFSAERDGLPFIDEPNSDNIDSVLESEEEIEDLSVLECHIAEAEEELKAMKAKRDAYYERMLDYMSAGNIDSLGSINGDYKLKRAYDRESIDTKALKKDHPEIASQYVRRTTVKATISFTPFKREE